MSKIPFTVIGGYLGAGKTTLLNKLLSQAGGRRVALLVNDFGEINIDAGLIESETDAQINLTNGCVCCTMVDGFYTAVDELVSMTPRPDHIVVEASGVADVSNLAQYGYGHDLALDGVLVLADVTTIRSKVDDKYVAQTIRRQLKAADLIVLNKTDLVSEQQCAEVQDWLQQTFAGCRVVASQHGNVPLAALLGIHNSGVDEPGGHPRHEHVPHERYVTWQFTSDTAIARADLDQFLRALDDTVLRLKGTVLIEEDQSLLVQCVGRRQDVTPMSKAAAGSQLVAIGLDGQLDIAKLDAMAADWLATS